MESDSSICSLHAELIYVPSILRKQRQVQLIHLPAESSALPAEALVINDRAVVSTQAGWAARATIHFPSSPWSADCCTEKWDVPSKLTLAFIPAWTQLFNQPMSLRAPGRRHESREASIHTQSRGMRSTGAVNSIWKSKRGAHHGLLFDSWHLKV